MKHNHNFYGRDWLDELRDDPWFVYCCGIFTGILLTCISFVAWEKLL